MCRAVDNNIQLFKRLAVNVYRVYEGIAHHGINQCMRSQSRLCDGPQLDTNLVDEGSSLPDDTWLPVAICALNRQYVCVCVCGRGEEMKRKVLIYYTISSRESTLHNSYTLEVLPSNTDSCFPSVYQCAVGGNEKVYGHIFGH